MSEHEAYVACTCFRDGLTSEPPVPRSALTFDRFGNVTLRSSRSPEEDPEPLWDWRSGWEEVGPPACAHDHMRLAERIWSTGNWRESEVGATISAGPYSALHEVLDNGRSFGGATILATSELATDALPELEQVLAIPTGLTTRVLKDDAGRTLLAPVDSKGYRPGLGFTPFWPREYPKERISGITEAGADDIEIVVRDYEAEGREWFRTDRLKYGVEPENEVFLGHRMLYRTSFYNDARGQRFGGLAPRIWLFDHDEDLFPWVGPEELHLEVRELRISDLAWYLRPLRAFMHASIQTGNPLVGYYNGSSLGFD